MTRGRVAFVVLGCAKNQVEAETMTARLARDGWALTADVSSADGVVVHSCGFLEAARSEARETLDQVRRAAPRAFLVLTGCFAQFLNNKKIPGVDAVLGTGQLDRLSDVLSARGAAVSGGGPSGLHDAGGSRPLRPGQLSAYLRVSEGCNHRCTFCIIPQLRGPLKSRSVDDILIEAEDLTRRGVRELVVISQDTTDYGTDRGRPGLVPLVKKLVKTSARWVRLLYAYPSEVSPSVRGLLAHEPKLGKYLDMPLQHISDRVLKAMGRDWGERKTRGLLESLRKQVPGVVLRTTFIVGFPGETDDDFERVVQTIRDGHFEHVGVFPYSFETRSPSARLPGLVPGEIVSERWQRLLDEHRRIKEKKDKARKGALLEVLAERAPDGRWAVRAAHQAPEVDGGVQLKSEPPAPGFYTCRVTGVAGIDLTGERVL